MGSGISTRRFWQEAYGFYKAGGVDLSEVPATVAKLDACVKAVQGCRIIYNFFYDRNKMVYGRRFLCRLISAHPGFTEMLYMQALTGAGKDV